MNPKEPTPALARHVARDVLDWDDLEPRRHDTNTDLLGLSAADRHALGMSSPGALDLQSMQLGGAETALADALGRGGAARRPDFRRKH